jgi:hypothetical protein
MRAVLISSFLLFVIVATEPLGLAAPPDLAKAFKSRVPWIDWSSVDVYMLNRQNKARTKQDGWAPRIRFQVYGATKNGDLVLATLKSGGKVHGKCQCGWESPGVSCQFPDDTAVRTGGKFTVELVYKYVTESMDSKEAKLATLAFNVIKYNIHPANGVEYIVDFDNRVEEGYIEFRPDDSCAEMRVFFFYKGQGNKEQPNPEFPGQTLGRCFYQGKPVGQAATGSWDSFDAKSYTPYKGTTELPKIGWYGKAFFAGGVYARKIDGCKRDDMIHVADSPGDWVCKIMFDGVLIRELKFTVKKPEGGGDPIIVAHPDQAKIFTGKKYLVKVELKKGWKLDAKHRDMAWKTEGFFGQGRTEH